MDGADGEKFLNLGANLVAGRHVDAAVDRRAAACGNTRSSYVWFRCVVGMRMQPSGAQSNSGSMLSAWFYRCVRIRSRPGLRSDPTLQLGAWVKLWAFAPIYFATYAVYSGNASILHARLPPIAHDPLLCACAAAGSLALICDGCCWDRMLRVCGADGLVCMLWWSFRSSAGLRRYGSAIASQMTADRATQCACMTR